VAARRLYPPAFLADSDDWRAQYVRTFLEHDLRDLGIDVPAPTMHRLWMMLCHFHSQVLNTAEIARSLDVAQTTAKRYIDILCGAFMLRRLHLWFANVAKRQIRSTKIYFRDSGVLHHLLGIKTRADLLVHPALGRSWEGLVLEQ
jgi:predicted AAA+ superfamily ATPase